jgi:hypothetical protein
VDRTRFDDLTKIIAAGATTRRRAIKLLAGTVLGGALARVRLGPGTAGAAGCRRVGEGCRSAAKCCSGVCRGPKGKKTCRAHGVGTCRPEQDFCLEEDGFCNGTDECICLTTTGGALFCAAAGGICTVCERDRDCLELGFPPGSACVRLSGGRCTDSCTETGGTICIAPCGIEAPAPEGVAPAGRVGLVAALAGNR